MQAFSGLPQSRRDAYTTYLDLFFEPVRIPAAKATSLNLRKATV